MVAGMSAALIKDSVWKNLACWSPSHYKWSLA